MAKDKSPSDLTKLTDANLFGDGDSKGSDAYEDKRNVKSSQNTKILDYFNALSEAERESILKNLHADNKQEQFMRDKTKFPNPYPVKVEATTEDIKKADRYDNVMQLKRKHEIASKYGSSTIPLHKLSSGLQITLFSCTERDLKGTRTIIGKQERGNDAITCKKTWTR
jgi:hypothetical protein